MKAQVLLIVTITVSIITTGYGQDRKKVSQYFDEPMVMDSSTTLFIPLRYDASLFSSDKLTSYGDYYSNIIVYDYKTDQSRPLFPNDTYIESLTPGHSYKSSGIPQHVSTDWVFYRVKSTDYNGNGKIDVNDPFVLFVSTRTGTNLKQLTHEREHVASLSFFEKFGFILVKIVRDSNGDRNFKTDDSSYYLKIDLKTLESGKPIEMTVR